MSKIWNIPNILSMFRILLTIPIAFALWHEENVIAVLIAFLSSITDNLDGYIARRFNQITELGKILDPLSDKLFIGVIAVILLIQGRMPVWFAAVIWGRDILLLLGGMLAAKKMGWVIPSNVLGKMTITAVGLTIMFMMLNVDIIVYYGLWVSTIFMAVSFIYYLIRMIGMLKEQQKKAIETNLS